VVALTWAGLIDWQTIKLPVAVKFGPRSWSKSLLASQRGPAIRDPWRGLDRLFALVNSAEGPQRPAI
jgi:hypothetical protein